ncbi:MAG: hypothetical protein OSB47_11560 [Pirellulaceae bacterium]|nr:hypothetical protein [Pirellulaceae bacterium]
MTTALGIASIPERTAGLARVIRRLLPQVDHAYVYLDKYPAVPSFLDDPRITVYESHLHGNHGGPGKFLGALEHEGYYVTVDDDIKYPRNYVEVMREVVAQGDNRVCAGVHGVILDASVTNYYRHRTLFHFRKRLRVQTPVHLMGTGTLCFHAGVVRVSSNWLQHDQRFSDITISLDLEQQKIPRVCVARKAKWLKPLQEKEPQQTLFGQGTRDPAPATQLVNSIHWKKLAA